MTINIGHIPQSESRSGAEEWTVESALRIYMESGIQGLVCPPQRQHRRRAGKNPAKTGRVRPKFAATSTCGTGPGINRG